ncbi:MAG TPA: mechanosensitive ion channel domain-containing protein [Pirellulales bacterium]
METRRELRQKRKEISEQIAAITQRRSEGDGKASDADDEQLALLRSIDAVEFHHQSLLEHQAQLEAEVADADKRLARLDEFAPNEPKPYSFLVLEGLKDQLAEQQREETALKTDLKSAEQLLTAAHDELDKAAQRRRAASGATPATEENAKQESGTTAQYAAPDSAANGVGAHAGDAENAAAAESATARSRGATSREASAGGSGDRQLGLQLAVTLAREKVALGRTNVEVAKLRLSANTARQKQLAKKIAAVEKDVEFSAQDRDTELARLAGLEADADHRRIVAETRFHRLETQDKPATPPPAGVRAPTEERPELRAAGEFYDATLLLLDQQREQLATERELWRDRYELAQGKASGDRAGKWLDAVKTALAGLDDWSQAWEHRFNALSDEPIEAPDGNSAAERAAPSANAPEGAFRDFSSAYAAARREARHARLGWERFRDELSARLAASASQGSTIVGKLAAYWNLEVLSDEKDKVTLGKLVILLAYILLGLVLAYAASWLVGGRLLRRLGWHRGKAAALKSILFYTLFLFFGVVAFRALQIPLGAFAFLGGAAAIAVGFGSQDIMNNFMSGIILLAEQPVRVGDIIEFSAGQGQVTYIGLRSTRLLTEANHEMIVANKLLLDETVRNLTLSDRIVQMTVTIDVDRPLPVAPTKRKMLKLAFSHPLVIKTSPPIVLLTEVDTYALRFEIHFWVEHQNFMKCAIVQSEVLEMITAAFPPLDSELPAPAGDAAAEGDTADNDAANDDTTDNDTANNDAANNDTATNSAAKDGAVDAGADGSDARVGAGTGGSGGTSADAGRGRRRNDEKTFRSPSPRSGSNEVSREITANIRKLSRAAMKKEIRRAGLG